MIGTYEGSLTRFYNGELNKTFQEIDARWFGKVGSYRVIITKAYPSYLVYDSYAVGPDGQEQLLYKNRMTINIEKFQENITVGFLVKK